MFEAAELGRRISREECTEQLPVLRAALLQSQQALIAKGVSVVVLIAGLDGAGKAEVVNRLNEWLDPRGIDTHTFWQPSDEERERPPWWRYWRVLPSCGRIAVLFGGWYSDLLPRRAYGEIKNKALDRELDRVAAFEQMLAADGILLVKLWFHLS